MLTIFSLIGLPPLAGFFPKYSVFQSLVASGDVFFALILFYATTIPAYFYLGLCVELYFSFSSSFAPVMQVNSISYLLIAYLSIINVGFIFALPTVDYWILFCLKDILDPSLR